ncbi:MAG TPA: hypothetical protein VGS11_05020 [Candidatus Bathyarchaeia archaeon]|nr:hypothetical protein [Candidatus Bathyarchaeia archaeon]
MKTNPHNAFGLKTVKFPCNSPLLTIILATFLVHVPLWSFSSTQRKSPRRRITEKRMKSAITLMAPARITR